MQPPRSNLGSAERHLGSHEQDAALVQALTSAQIRDIAQRALWNPDHVDDTETQILAGAVMAYLRGQDGVAANQDRQPAYAG